MSISNNLTGRRETLVHAARELEGFKNAVRHSRRTISAVPPDELSKTDLLAMRAGMLSNLATMEALTASLTKLLNTIAESIHHGNDDP